MFLSKIPSKDVLLVNASREFKKGKPKNYIPAESIDRIVNVIEGRQEVEGFSVLLDIQAIQDIDYDLSPQRHIPIDPEIGDLDYNSLATQLEEAETRLGNLRKRRSTLTAEFTRILKNSGKLPKGWREARFADVISEDVSGDWGEENPAGDGYIKCAIIRGTDFPDLKLRKVSSCPYRFVKEGRYESKHPRAGDLIVEISGGRQISKHWTCFAIYSGARGSFTSAALLKFHEGAKNQQAESPS